MTDLEMTKLCAEAMGYKIGNLDGDLPGVGCIWIEVEHGYLYAPLEDDAQAMALLKTCEPRLLVDWCDEMKWFVCDGEVEAVSENLNRAIVECVAKMQAKANGAIG